MKTKEIKEILWAAADLLDRDGWIQGSEKIGEKHCIIGACRSVIFDRLARNKYNVVRDTTVRVAEISFILHDYLDMDPIHYNDGDRVEGICKEEVIQTLINCAESLI